MIKYLGSISTGTAFETGETRSVDVTGEINAPLSGFEGDAIVYTATVLDSAAAKLPASFEATLKLNGTDLIIGQVFDATVYDQATGLLTLNFVVPAPVGAFDVTLNWADQII